MLRSTTAMREIRQCSARERMRSSSSSRLESVRAASRVANSRAVSSRSDSPSSAQYLRTTSSAGISATSAAKSICKAHSRALRREPIELPKPAAFCGLTQKLPCKDLPVQPPSWRLQNPCSPASLPRDRLPDRSCRQSRYRILPEFPLSKQPEKFRVRLHRQCNQNAASVHE